MTLTLAELGEAELLKRLARFAPPGQLDDDTAYLLSLIHILTLPTRS